MPDTGKLVARTGLEGPRVREEAGTPTLTSVVGTDKLWNRILVSCWVAKLWSKMVMLKILKKRAITLS